MKKNNVLTKLYRERGNQLIADITPFLSLLLLIAIFGIATDGRMLRLKNAQLILMQSVIVMIGAMGTSFVMAHGNLEFSLGGELAICALVGYFANTVHPYLMLPACLLTGVVLNCIIGGMHVFIGLPSFISGMSVMFIGSGIVQLVAAGGLFISPIYNALDKTWFYITVLLVVAAVMVLLFDYTNIGRYNKLIGSNPRAAFLSGINVGKYKLLAFLVSGCTVGISAFLTLVRTSSVAAQTGQTYAIDCIIVMTLGGAPLSGGSGMKIRNSIIGALTYFILSNGFVQMGVSAEVIYIIKGVLFLAIVAFSFDRNNKL